MTMKRTVFVLGLGAAFCLAAGSGWAEEGQDGKTSGGLTVGAQGGSGIDDSSKLQQFETVPTGVFLPEAWFSWKGDTDYFLNLKGTKLGLDDQFASLVGGKKDVFKLSLTWDQNPNWMSNTARTPYTEVQPGVFHVPDGMRQSLQNVYVPWTGAAPANPTVANFFAVEPWVAQSQPIDLRYLRKTGTAALSVEASDNLTLNASYARELRNGNKNLTFYGGPSYEVAAPIDFQTDTFKAGADFADGRWFASAGVNYSKFTNEVPVLYVDNPERLELQNPTTGANVINDVATFQLVQPPDNKAYNVDVTAGVNLPKRHKITGSLSTGRMSMETDLVNLSTNPNLRPTAANPAFSLVPPYANIEAKYNTFMGAARLTGDPFSKFGYSLTFRKYELADKTEHYSFGSTVRGDVGPSVPGEPLMREHEGYGTQSIRGEVHVLPVAGLRLSGSYGEDRRDYDIREYADVKDRVIQASLDYTHDWLAFRGSWNNLDRKPGDSNSEAVAPTWQGATQTDIVERTRNLFSGMLTLMPNDKLAVALTGQKQTNDFAESVTGLLEQSFDSFGVDLTYSPNQKVTAYAGYVYENYFFNMAAAYIVRGGAPPYLDANYWENATTDKIDTFRGGLKWTALPDKLDVDLSVDYTKPRSDSNYTFFPERGTGGANEANGVFPANSPPLAGFPVTTFDSFPQVSKDFLILKASVSYHIDKRITASALYWKQKYDNVDWATDQMQPYMGKVDPGANRWFFLGASVPAYDADIFRVSLSYKF